jgi:hypothetical protein
VKRRARFEALSLAVDAAALACVLLAIALGAPAARLGRAAWFLGAGAAASLYVEVVFHLKRLRARRQERATVPRGVRLREPLWMRISDWLAVVGFLALGSAVAGAAGAVGVGVGILLTVVLLATAMDLFTARFSASGLTFEPEGLRVHIRDASFLIGWKAIAGIDRQGDEGRVLNVRILDAAAAIRSVEPNTPRTRGLVSLVLSATESGITFGPWTAGLSTPALARAIGAAIGGERRDPN